MKLRRALVFERGDNKAWKNKRLEWADVMWEARGQTKI
jgi:hypothetical protein